MPQEILTICIPTYKRKNSLRISISSVLEQIEKFNLTDFVKLYVVDDASPDETKAVLSEFSDHNYFLGISRQVNLGMNQNIKAMLQEASLMSRFQLVLTDDDYLQPDCLEKIVKCLQRFNDDEAPAAIWTPRYSYTEDGQLHTILCQPFKVDHQLAPSVFDAGRYMDNGFVLSGLIIRNDAIDFSFWDHYRDNAYFPAIFFGDILLRFGARYWPKNIVRHMVLNECHWERWGKNDIMISLRLFSDFVEAYKILSTRMRAVDKFIFYLGSIAGIAKVANGPLTFDALRGDLDAYRDALQELKRQGYLRFDCWVRLVMAIAIGMHLILATAKAGILTLLGMVNRGAGDFSSRRNVHLNTMRQFPRRLKLMLGMS